MSETKAMAVRAEHGMAIAERMLAARFNRLGFNIIDHYTYGIASDGDLIEGVSSEACSSAGNLYLGKLIVFYDDNHITIEGSTELAFCEKVADGFRRCPGSKIGYDVKFVTTGRTWASQLACA